MTTDLYEHALRLLQGEPTHSLPLDHLRQRLVYAAAGGLPTASSLEHALGRDPRFRVLRLPGAGVAAEFAGAIEAAGIAQDVRVVLVGAPEEHEAELPVLGNTRGTLLAALARDAALAAHVGAALGELERVGARLFACELSDAGTDPTTTPLPDPPAPPRSRRRWRLPASSPPRSAGSR